MNSKLITPIFFSLLIIYGCSKDDNPTSNTTSVNHIYNLAIGNQWIYSNGDTITIDASKTLNGKTVYHFKGLTDYTFGKPNLYYDGTKLYGCEDTSAVSIMLFDEVQLDSLPKGQLTVLAGTFDTFKYYSSNITYWVAKDYGLIRIGNSKGVVDLIKYSIK